MRAFLIRGQSLEAKATYNEETGILCSIDIVSVKHSAEHKDHQVLMGFLGWMRMTTTVAEMDHWISHPPNKNTQITEIVADLSFDAFWTAFDYKMGNRSRVETAWAKMSTEDKNACMLSLKRYKTWKKLNPNIAHMYGETYLNQRRWENEYKVN